MKRNKGFGTVSAIYSRWKDIFLLTLVNPYERDLYVYYNPSNFSNWEFGGSQVLDPHFFKMNELLSYFS